MNRFQALLLPSLLLILSASGCSLCEPDPEASEILYASGPELHLVTYKVPEGRQQEVRTLLRETLASATPSGENATSPRWRVSLGPSGHLVVLAPASVHAGIKDLLAQIAAQKAPPPAPFAVAIDYWIYVHIQSKFTYLSGLYCAILK